MSTLRRPDGVEIHWEERGVGPPVLVAPHFWAFPAVYQGLLDELARDHRVVTYDPRGSGGSTRVAPASPVEDSGDMAAVLAAAGGGFVVVGFGDSAYRAAAIAAADPDLTRTIVIAGATVLQPESIGGGEGLVSSSSVLDTMSELFDRNPRAGMRGMLELTNPAMTGDELRARVNAALDYGLEEALRVRLRWFRAGGSPDDLQALGDRLWIAHWDSPWSPPELVERLQELLPSARLERLTHGSISRPDLTAALVRRAAAGS